MKVTLPRAPWIPEQDRELRALVLSANSVDTIAGGSKPDHFCGTRPGSRAELEISTRRHQRQSVIRRCRTCYRRRCFLFDGLGRTCRSARGLCAGHRLQEILQALKTGPNSKMAVSYFEWSASSDQKIIIPWRVIDGPESADAVAAEIMKTPVRRGSRTSISGAINFAMPLFEENPYRGLRRVIDICGDGPNNNGVPVTGARRGAREGHHHQRPADHGEGAVICDDGHR